MKTLFSLSTFFCLLLFANTSTIGQEIEITAITKAIESNDSKIIYNHCENAINLSIPGTNGKYSRIQARKILDLFFKNNPAKKVVSMKSQSEGQDSYFKIIEYQSEIKIFNFYIQLKKTDNQFLIQKIQIQEVKS